MYEYLDRRPEAGDIVESQKTEFSSFTKGKLYICKRIDPDINSSIDIAIDDSGSTNGWNPNYFKVVKTKSGSEAKVGDTCIRVGDNANNQYNGSKKGDIFNVTHMAGVCVGYKKDFSMHPDNAKVLCLAKTKPKAYYKSSGKPWTVEEIAQIPNSWNPKYANYNLQNKWAYPSIGGEREYFPWAEQRPDRHSLEYDLVAFEDEFPEIKAQPLTIPIGSHWQEMYTSTSIGQIVEVVKLGINSVHFEHIETGERKNRSTSEFLNYFIPVQKLPISPSELGAQAEPTKPIIKEQSMNFQQLINSIFQEEIQTDYDKKPDYLVVIYNNEGTEIAQATADSIATVEAKIQSTPKLWGCKAVCYKIDTEVQTQVPVTSTKIKKSK